MVQPIASPGVWGPDGKLVSPAAAKRDRDIAALLLNAKPQATGFWGFLGQAGSALAGAGLNQSAAAAEREGQEAASALFSGLGSGASTDAIAQALMNPAAAWATPGQLGVAEALMNTGLKQQDPMYQLQLQQAQLELEQMRNPAPANPYMNVGGGYVFNQATGEFIQAPNAGATDMPADVQEYEFYRQQSIEAGQQPLSYLEYQNALKGNGFSVTTPDGTVIQHGGPQKPLTEGQSKDAVYATRANNSLPLLEQNETALLSLGENVAGNAPLLGNYMQSEEYQLARDAGKEFLAAILRKDSGGAITPDEEKTYGFTFLPQPGDKPATLAAKRQRRQLAVDAIEAGMPQQAIDNMTRALQANPSPALSQPAPSEVPTAPPAVIDWTEL